MTSVRSKSPEVRTSGGYHPPGWIGGDRPEHAPVQYGEHILIIDAGLMFPEDYMLGIDIVIPDFSYLLKNRERIRADCPDPRP